MVFIAAAFDNWRWNFRHRQPASRLLKKSFHLTYVRPAKKDRKSFVIPSQLICVNGLKESVVDVIMITGTRIIFIA